MASIIESISVTPSLGTALDSARRSAGPTRSLLLGIVSSLNDIRPNPADTDSLQLDTMSGAIGNGQEVFTKIYSEDLFPSLIRSKPELVSLDMASRSILSWR